MELAASRIAAFHQKQLPQDIAYTDATGVKLGLNYIPLAAVTLAETEGLPAHVGSLSVRLQ